MQSLKVIAFTHKSIPLNELGRFFLDEGHHNDVLQQVKSATGIDELLYLSTCNRIEFVFTCSARPDTSFLKNFFIAYSSPTSAWNEAEIEFAVNHALIYEGQDALTHLMRVATSLDSMVIGEREIITQVRNAYDRCKAAGLTGDYIRLVIKNVINLAKEVFTDTHLAQHPVSVVSLAFRKLRGLNVAADARFIIVGAGETNASLLKYLSKHGYKNFDIFNRTISKAQQLAVSFKTAAGDVNAYSLDELKNYNKGFDVLISCTGSSEAIINADLYQKLVKDNSKKILIDLALPADIDEQVVKQFPVHYIGLNELKGEAERNLLERHSEIESAEQIILKGIEEFHAQLRTRKLELKMSLVPEKIRAIKDKALNDVFAKDIESLDENSKELLHRVMNYIEKKYVSVPMIMAKEIILETSAS